MCNSRKQSLCTSITSVWFCIRFPFCDNWESNSKYKIHFHIQTLIQSVCTSEQTHSSLRRRNNRGLLYVTNVWSSEITEHRDPEGRYTHTHTELPSITLFVSRQAFLCLPSCRWKLPMALWEVTITHLYDIWHLQFVSINTDPPFSWPKCRKTQRRLSSFCLCPQILWQSVLYEWWAISLCIGLSKS